MARSVVREPKPTYAHTTPNLPSLRLNFGCLAYKMTFMEFNGFDVRKRYLVARTPSKICSRVICLLPSAWTTASFNDNSFDTFLLLPGLGPRFLPSVLGATKGTEVNDPKAASTSLSLAAIWVRSDSSCWRSLMNCLMEALVMRERGSRVRARNAVESDG